MEKYEFVERTNYFKVNNVEHLKNVVQNIKGAELLENAKGEFAIAGYVDIENVYDEGGDDIVDVVPFLKPLLPDGEVVIFTCIAHKALLSVKAYARIVTNNADNLISLTDMAIQQAN
jgi:hypothetical protein